MKWLEARLRSFYQHVTRPRAVGAWAIAFLTVVIDLGVGGETVHELAAVIVGVLMSFVLLPDPAGDVQDAVAQATIWLQRPEVLRDVVPEARLRSAAANLLESIQASRGALAWRHGAAPILDAPAEAIYDDFNYSILMTPGSGNAAGWYVVETTCSAERVFLTPPEVLWASFVQTVPALEAEYSDYSCLNREIVPRVAWEKAIELRESDPDGEWLSATLRVGGEEIRGSATETRRALRVTFRPEIAAQTPLHLTVRSRFLLPLTDHSFPVKMENYFCRGRTEVRFQIQDPNACDVDAFVSAPGLGGTSTDLLQQVHGGLRGEQAWRIGTPAETLLFPGAGVMWTWRHSS